MQEKIDAIMKEFTDLLKKVFAGDLVSVVLYGSAAWGGYCEGVSDINAFVILEKSNAVKLFEFGQAAKTLIRKYRISPFILTKEEFRDAADVFPMEYFDILENHYLVYGDNGILDITVNRENFRLQMEEKLRGAVGDLRNMLIAAGGNERLLKRFLINWSALGGVLFRGLLRLKGKNVIGSDNETTLALVEKEYNVSLEGFSALNRLRQAKKIRDFSASSLVDTLLEPLTALVHTVDTMNGKCA